MLAVVDERIPDAASHTLRSMGFDVLRMPPCPSLAEPVSAHPDMLLFFAPSCVLCTEEYAAVARDELAVIERVTKRPIVTVRARHGRDYPSDILLNAAPVGERLFCLPSHTAEEILQVPSLRVCPVKQGYAKCSTLPIGTHALITEDTSIAARAEAEGLSVLRVSKGDVRLSGYDTGFLGGASSFAPYARIQSVLFCGALSHHRDGTAIDAFCRRHGYEPVSLGDFPLTDVGTIFLL